MTLCIVKQKSHEQFQKIEFYYHNRLLRLKPINLNIKITWLIVTKKKAKNQCPFCPKKKGKKGIHFPIFHYEFFFSCLFLTPYIKSLHKKSKILKSYLLL